MYIVIILLVSLLFVIVLKKLSKNPDLSQFNTPEILSDDEYYSISIPVEIDDKNGKKAFVQLFEQYGFSGNGPSIEQIVRKNTKFSGVEFDSEGDCFLMYAQSREHQAEILNELKRIQNIDCLNSWLRKASWILIKE